jgi:hypothetical protein
MKRRQQGIMALQYKWCFKNIFVKILKIMTMKKITILLIAIAALGAGCKRFIDINQNLNQPLTVTPNVVLSAALAGSAADQAGAFLNSARWMGYWSRSGNYIADVPTETYNISATYEDGDFQGIYNTLGRYAYIEKAGDASKTTLPFYLGVAKTMKAFHFAELVDGFGNVPYKQAFQINTTTTPAYDDAKAIYADLIVQLDSAFVYFELAKVYYAAPTTVASVITTDDKYDIMFGRAAGVAPSVRMSEWETFANTVKLKLLMHESNVLDVATISAELNKTSSYGYIQAGASASVNPGYSSSSVAQYNPFWGIFYTASGQSNTYAFLRANQYSINFLNGTNDATRPALFYAPNGGIVGNYDGDPQAQSNSTTAGLGTGILKSASQDQLIISDFESLFLQAEAAQLGILPGGNTAAKTLVRTAVEQNYIYLGDNAGDADTYLDSNTGNKLVDVTAGGLQAIITQKWAADNGINWYESYIDFRRTGYPAEDGVNFGVTHAPNPIKHNGNPTIPYRFLYPQSEINSNGKNVPSLPAAQYTPIFWDTLEK